MQSYTLASRTSNRTDQNLPKSMPAQRWQKKKNKCTNAQQRLSKHAPYFFNKKIYLSNQIQSGDEMIGLKTARFLAKPVSCNHDSSILRKRFKQNKNQKKDSLRTKAKVWQPFPASIASLPNTCFLACTEIITSKFKFDIFIYKMYFFLI